MSRPRPSTVAAAAMVMFVVGCGDAAATSPSPPSLPSSPVSTGAPPARPRPEASPVLPVTMADATGTEVTVTSASRIVPVDGDLAEVVYALGLGANVVAVDLSATYPPEVDELPVIGYQRALSPEPIAAVEPTVVLATDLAGPIEALEQLRLLSIPVVVIERTMTLDGPAAKVRAVARALGVPERGEVLAAQVQRGIDAARAAAGGLATGDANGAAPRVTALYLRGDRVQLLLGDGTGIDAVLSAVGAIDVAAELGVVDTRQISAEALLLARPDVLLVTTTGLASVGGIDGLLAIPGIAQTPAGHSGRVLAYEDQYLLGLGPRTGALLLELLHDLHP